MAVKHPVVVEKRDLKASCNQRVPLRPAAARKVMLSPAEMGTSSEQTAVFDPRLLLTKLGVGKSKQEYQDDEAVFSQGDAADAVFYLQSGKVKLTAVSTRGKEAVVAILPEGSFFGEGFVWLANRFACPPLAQSDGAPSFGWRSE